MKQGSKLSPSTALQKEEGGKDRPWPIRAEDLIDAGTNH
jgi:hypothetical protein